MVAYTALFRAVADFSGALRENQKLAEGFRKVGVEARNAKIAGAGLGGQVSAGLAAALPAVTKLSRTLTLGVSVPVAILGRTAVKTFADFEAQIVSAGSKSEATAAQLDAMKNKALEVGQRTKFSATEAATALDNMAQAGFNAQESVDTLDAVVDAASASNSDLALTTTVVTKSMNAFNITAKESGRVADILAAVANSTNLNMQGLADALGQVGEVGPRFHQSLEDVLAVVGRLVDMGVPAASAGTAVRQALTFLSAPTGKAASAMRDLGIEVRDATGRMLPLPKIIENVKNGINSASGVTKAYGGIVGLNGTALKAWAKQHNTNIQVARALQKAVESGGDAFKDYATRMLFGVEGAKAFSLAMSDGKPVIIDINTETAKMNRLLNGLSVTMGRRAAEAFVKAHTEGDKFVAASVDAIKSVSALETGSKGLSTQMAKMFQATTKQKLDNLNSAFETLAIIFVEKIKPGLDRNIERITAWVNSLTDAVRQHPKLVAFVTVFAAIAAAIGPGLFIMAKLVGTVQVLVKVFVGLRAALKTAVIWTRLYAEAAVAATKANTGWKSSIGSIVGLLARTGPWGVAILAATVLIGVLAKRHLDAKKAQEDARQAANDYATAMGDIAGKVDLATAALTDNVRAVAANRLQQAGAFPLADKLGISYKTLTDYALGNKDAQELVNRALVEAYGLNRLASKGNADMSNTALELGRILGKEATATRAAVEQTNAHKEAMGELASEMGRTTTKAEDLESAQQDLKSLQDDLSKKTNQFTHDLQALIDAFTVLRGGHLSEARLNDQLAAGFVKLGNTLKDNKKTLKGNSQAALENRAAFFDQFETINEVITAHYKAAYASSKHKDEEGKLKDAAKVATRELGINEEALRTLGRRAGLSKKDVEHLITQMLLTPEQLETQVLTPGMKDARGQIKELQDQIKALKDQIVKIKVDMEFDEAFQKTVIQGDYFQNPGAFQQHRAGGGPIYNLSGKGRQSYDTEPAMLRVDEHVWTPEEVDAAGGHDKVKQLRQAALKGMLHFRDGGPVTRRVILGTAGPRADEAMDNIDGALRRATKASAAAAHDMTAKYLKKLNDILAAGGPGGPLGMTPVEGGSGLTTFNGGTFTRQFAAALAKVQHAIGRILVVFQGGFRPTSSFSGSTHNKDAIDFPAMPDAIRAFRRYAGAAGDRTGLGPWMSHAHGVPAPGHGYPSPSAAAQYRDYIRRGGGSQPLRSPWGLRLGSDNTNYGTYLVGEDAPELLRTRGGSQVSTSRQTLDYLSKIEAMAVRAPKQLSDTDQPAPLRAGEPTSRGGDSYTFEMPIYYPPQPVRPTMALQRQMVAAGRTVTARKRGTSGV